MKAVLSAVILVGVLALTLSDRQPTQAGPPPVPAAPPVLVRAPVAKDKPDPLAKEVQAAQEKGIKYLKEALRDQAGGMWSWDDPTLGVLQKGGPSALAALALLESGVKVDDQSMRRAFPYLRSVEPENTYVVSLLTQVFCKANQKEDADRIQRNVRWLEDAASWKGDQLQGWSYGSAGGAAGRADNSNTRYAVAALHAAHRAGFKVSKDGFWDAVRAHYVRTQAADGGWTYSPGAGRPTHTMTVSGLLCLSLSGEVIGKDDKATEAARNGGYGWVANNFRLQNSPHTFYNFDVIAALGRASGKKEFGTKDKNLEWYRLGAEWLHKNQKPDGKWMIDDALDKFPVVSTAFALRFLASRPD